MTPTRKSELLNILSDMDDFIEQFAERAKTVPLRGPIQMIGVLNVLAMVYRKTVENDVDPMEPNAPLVALPNHLRMIEERMDLVLQSIASTSIRTLVEK